MITMKPFVIFLCFWLGCHGSISNNTENNVSKPQQSILRPFSQSVCSQLNTKLQKCWTAFKSVKSDEHKILNIEKIGSFCRRLQAGKICDNIDVGDTNCKNESTYVGLRMRTSRLSDSICNESNQAIFTDEGKCFNSLYKGRDNKKCVAENEYIFNYKSGSCGTMEILKKCTLSNMTASGCSQRAVSLYQEIFWTTFSPFPTVFLNCSNLLSFEDKDPPSESLEDIVYDVQSQGENDSPECQALIQNITSCNGIPKEPQSTLQEEFCRGSEEVTSCQRKALSESSCNLKTDYYPILIPRMEMEKNYICSGSNFEVLFNELYCFSSTIMIDHYCKHLFPVFDPQTYKTELCGQVSKYIQCAVMARAIYGCSDEVMDVIIKLYEINYVQPLRHANVCGPHFDGYNITTV